MAPRAIASATVSFGLVTIPVRLYPATSPKGLSFHLLHAKDKARVRQQYVCSKCGEMVSRGDLVKGYEYAKGRYVAFTDRELAALESQTDHTIEIEEFVSLAAVDPVYFAKCYLLGADKGGAKAYRLLCEAMARTGQAALGRFFTRGRQEFALLRQAGGALLLHALYYADEVADFRAVETGADVRLKPAEIDLATQLVGQLSAAEFHPERYEDEHRKRLLQLVEEKVAGHEVTVAPAAAPKAQIIDLMDALKASLAARAGGGREAAGVRRPARAKGKTGGPGRAARAK